MDETNVLYFLQLHHTWHEQNQGVSDELSIGAFDILETTIEDIHGAYQSGQLTARQLVQTYLDRIAAYNNDRQELAQQPHIINISWHAKTFRRSVGKTPHRELFSLRLSAWAEKENSSRS
jgi:hypothetical protein